METELWTLAELADRVADALSSGYGGQQSRRVTDVPDTRAIRYYTTLGLLDRPAEMRGRTALYGPRHLWQLVAIKRLQADGRSLATIQHELAAASDGTLRRIADIPDPGFWRQIPAATAPRPAPPAAPTVRPASGSATPAPAAEPSANGHYQAIPLPSGAIVLLPRGQALTDIELDTLRQAAAPLDSAIARLTKGQP
jgi:DNA-binding transcriptional MerR regulator